MNLEFDGYRPGCVGDIVSLHARYYAAEWGFGLPFETKVATEMAAFLSRRKPDRDLFLTAYRDGRAVGSITIDASGGGPRGAHLRWFIVSEDEHGQGLGKKLLGDAMDFCQTSGLSRVWLTTFSGLDAARKLYEQFGFVLVDEKGDDQWQGGVREQRFERLHLTGGRGGKTI